MVKLIQTKYIKQLFIFLVFTFLFSYQQNAKAESGSLNAAIEIMANNGVPTTSITTAVGSDDVLNSDVLGLLSFAVAGEDNYLMDNYTESEMAFITVLKSDTDTYEAVGSAAATVMIVDTLSLLVSLVDELIVYENAAGMDKNGLGNALRSLREDVAGSDAYNPMVVALGKIAAYSELFEGYRSFLRSNLNTTYRRIGRANRNPIREMRRAFKSDSDYLSGRALQQTPECSSLFCSLYTLRLENPDVSINEFVMTQMQINEFYDAAIGDPTPAVREMVNNFVIGDAINANLNSLRQSRAGTETVLPGNDPYAGQQQQQQQQEQEEEWQ
jgi:hypothetical protein